MTNFINYIIQDFGMDSSTSGAEVSPLEETRKSIVAQRMQSEHDFAEVLKKVVRIEGASLEDGSLNEPYFSIAFLVILGQRFATTTSILEMLLMSHGKSMYGREIALELAKRLDKPEAEFTRGSAYQRRVAQVIDALTEAGILVLAKSRRRMGVSGRAVHYEINPKHFAEIERFISRLSSVLGVLAQEPRTTTATASGRCSEILRERFDRKLGKVTHPSGDTEQFKASDLIGSLTGPDVGLPFYDALEVLESIEPRLKPHMKTAEIQRLVYSNLRSRNPKLAERYNREYPEEIHVKMSNGTSSPLGLSLVNKHIDLILRGYSIQNKRREVISDSVSKVFRNSPVDQMAESSLDGIAEAQISAMFDIPKDEIEVIVRQKIEHAGFSNLQRKSFCQSRAYDAANVQRMSISRDLVPAFLLMLGYAPLHDFESNLDLLLELIGRRSRRIASIFGVSPAALNLIYGLKKLEEPEESGNRRRATLQDYGPLIQTASTMLRSGVLKTEKVHKIFETD